MNSANKAARGQLYECFASTLLSGFSSLFHADHVPLPEAARLQLTFLIYRDRGSIRLAVPCLGSS